MEERINSLLHLHRMPRKRRARDRRLRTVLKLKVREVRERLGQNLEVNKLRLPGSYITKLLV